MTESMMAVVGALGKGEEMHLGEATFVQGFEEFAYVGQHLRHEIERKFKSQRGPREWWKRAVSFLHHFHHSESSSGDPCLMYSTQSNDDIKSMGTDTASETYFLSDEYRDYLSQERGELVQGIDVGEMQELVKGWQTRKAAAESARKNQKKQSPGHSHTDPSSTTGQRNRPGHALPVGV
jgi:hypothetical protein